LQRYYADGDLSATLIPFCGQLSTGKSNDLLAKRSSYPQQKKGRREWLCGNLDIWV
jgi:hypothetical protein